MSARLPLNVIAPADGESLLGYVRRLAAANAYADGGEFLAVIGHRYDRAFVESLPAFEASLDLPPGALTALAPAVAAEPVRQRRFERLHTAPVCPSCVAEGRPHARAWRHAFVTACTEHEVLLQDHCPRCGQMLGVQTGGFHACACGHTLGDLPAASADPIDVALSALIAGTPQRHRALLPAPLDERTPSDIGAFLFALASRSRAPATGKAGKSPQPRTMAETHAFLAPVRRMLSDWPAGFDAEIRARLAAADPTLPSAPARLGRWYQVVAGFKAEAYAPFRERLAQVIAETFEGPYVGALTRRDAASDGSAWVSATAAARALEVRVERLVKAVADGEVVGDLRHSGLGHRHCTVPRKVVDVLAVARRRYLDGRAATRRLGISRRQFRHLVDAGIVVEHPAAARPPLTDGGFDADALDELRHAIARRAHWREVDPIAFRDIDLRRTTDRGALLRVLRAIAEGTIAALSAPADAPLGDYLFDATAIDAAIARARRRDGLTGHQVAAILGCKPQVVAHWARLGLIEAERSANPRGDTLDITADALAAFQSRYVPVALLARRKRTSTKALLEALARHSVETFGDFEDGPARRGYLVDIGDLCDAAIRRRPPIPSEPPLTEGAVDRAGGR